jgi:hypothetical protein
MARWLGPGKQTFYIINDAGVPVPDVGGLLYHYEPGGDTPKDTWQDPEENALNTNPVVLDEFGQCQIFGVGLYRQLYVPSAGVGWDTITGDQDDTTPTVTDVYFDQPFEYLGSPPGANAVIGAFVFVRACQIAADFDGSDDGFAAAAGYQITAPTVEQVITVSRGSLSDPGLTTIGTITVAITGLWTWATTDHLPQSFDVDDFIKFTAGATPDATWTDIFWTVTGNVLA